MTPPPRVWAMGLGLLLAGKASTTSAQPIDFGYTAVEQFCARGEMLHVIEGVAETCGDACALDGPAELIESQNDCIDACAEDYDCMCALWDTVTGSCNMKTVMCDDPLLGLAVAEGSSLNALHQCARVICEGEEESGGMTTYENTDMPTGTPFATLVASLGDTSTSEGCAAACVWHSECTMVTYSEEPLCHLFAEVDPESMPPQGSTTAAGIQLLDVKNCKRTLPPDVTASAYVAGTTSEPAETDPAQTEPGVTEPAEPAPSGGGGGGPSDTAGASTGTRPAPGGGNGNSGGKDKPVADKDAAEADDEDEGPAAATVEESTLTPEEEAAQTAELKEAAESPTPAGADTGPTRSGPTESGPAESGPAESGPTESVPDESTPTEPDESGPTDPAASGPAEAGPEETGDGGGAEDSLTPGVQADDTLTPEQNAELEAQLRAAAAGPATAGKPSNPPAAPDAAGEAEAPAAAGAAPEAPLTAEQQAAAGAGAPAAAPGDGDTGNIPGVVADPEATTTEPVAEAGGVSNVSDLQSTESTTAPLTAGVGRGASATLVACAALLVSMAVLL